MAIFAVHFIYRYLVAARKKLLRTFQSKSIVFWMLIPVLSGSAWGFACYFLCGVTVAKSKYVRNNVLETYDLEIDDMEYVGPYFYQADDKLGYIIDVDSCLVIALTSAILVMSLSTVGYFGYKCYAEINKLMDRSSKSSARSRIFQLQLFYALVTQTLIPVILMHIPVFFLFVFTVLDMDIGMLSGTVTIAIALFPAIDPMPTMLIIKNYRSALIGVLTSCCRRKPRITKRDTSASINSKF
ncbi:unnamed protein product [Caenorhabditis sp. 36 PRJEB53466]|nr:unnamed protein product [Caenorhabditis sp. 36 PRJEB53466]